MYGARAADSIKRVGRTAPFADVPASFLAVHWTVLPGGEPNQGFVDNVKTLVDFMEQFVKANG